MNTLIDAFCFVLGCMAAGSLAVIMFYYAVTGIVAVVDTLFPPKEK